MDRLKDVASPTSLHKPAEAVIIFAFFDSISRDNSIRLLIKVVVTFDNLTHQRLHHIAISIIFLLLSDRLLLLRQLLLLLITI